MLRDNLYHLYPGPGTRSGTIPVLKQAKRPSVEIEIVQNKKIIEKNR